MKMNETFVAEVKISIRPKLTSLRKSDIQLRAASAKRVRMSIGFVLVYETEKLVKIAVVELNVKLKMS